MLIAYILACEDLALKDVLPFEDYAFTEDLDYSKKSQIIVTRQPNIANDDFVICKDGNDVVFIGLCVDYSSEQDNTGYTINLEQKERLFDRQIFLTNTDIKSTTGIEDFIVNQITTNWISSGDPLTDITYITAVATTHTPVAAAVSSIVNVENGIYNLKTFLGNAKEFYQVYLDYAFDYVQKTLTISVSVKTENILIFDATVSDVPNYEETYDVDVLSKLAVHWQQDENTDSYITYYLRSDRTITTDVNDPLRVYGVSKCVYIETDTLADMQQQAFNEFAGNSYNHKISLSIKKDSRIYQTNAYHVGRICRFKTKSGTRQSIITALSVSSDSQLVEMVFGKLDVTLLEKLRRLYKNA